MARQRYSDPTGAWIWIPGRRPGSARYGQAGRWLPVAGRPPGSPRYGLGRDRRGRFARVDRGPEARYEWSEDRRLSYRADGTYRLRGRRGALSRSEVSRIAAHSVVDRGPEARWRFYMRPPEVDGWTGRTYPRIDALRGAGPFDYRWKLDGRFGFADQAQWLLAMDVRNVGLYRLETWHDYDALGLGVDPDYEDLSGGVGDLEWEIGTAEVPLEVIQARYAEQGPLEDDLGSERTVPIEDVPDDPTEEARRAWADFETWMADETAFGHWIGRAKPRVPALVSYYLVAHKVVYEDRETSMFCEVIQTRVAPFGRGDAYVELKERAADMQAKSDEKVVFVAAGMKVTMRLLT